MKPAIFDLILAIGIALYLLAVFLVVSQFHVLKSAIQPAVYPYLNGVNGKASSPLRNGHAKKMWKAIDDFLPPFVVEGMTLAMNDSSGIAFNGCWKCVYSCQYARETVNWPSQLRFELKTID